LGNSATQAGISRAVLSPAKETLRYNITFYGPGGETITRAARWGETVSVQAASGEWRITVRAVDNSAAIKAFGEQNITVKPGAQNTAAVKMAVYTEAASWADVLNAVSAGTNDDFIVIKNNITTTGSTINVNANKTVTIVADGDRTITRGSVLTTQFFEVTGNGRLVLGGSSLYSGTLTLDGGGLAISNATVDVSGGSFTMHSGIIRGSNKLTGSGGGVFVNNNGTFTMTGGSITGNTVAAGNGGGVYIGGGSTFNLNAPATKGNVYGNSATMGSGNQVYVDSSATFKVDGVSHGSY
jgi:autotransporter-associated beta strand protein